MPDASQPRPYRYSVPCLYCVPKRNNAFGSSLLNGSRTFVCKEHALLEMAAAVGAHYEGPLPEEDESLSVLRAALPVEESR